MRSTRTLCDRPNRGTRLSPIEQLEGRLLLDGTNSFWSVAGEINSRQIGEVHRINLDPAALRIPGGTAYLNITASPTKHSQIDPGRILVKHPDGSRSRFTRLDAPGGLGSVMLVSASHGKHQVRLRAQQSQGSYNIDVSLAGDVNGNFAVTRKDLRKIHQALGARTGDSGYDPKIDVDSNGVVQQRDKRLAERNLGVRYLPDPSLIEYRDADFKGLYRVPGGADETATVGFEYLAKRAGFRNEIGLFITDDARGTVNGLMPGDAGYAVASLSSGRRRVLFAHDAPRGAAPEVKLPAGSFFGLYLVQNGKSQTFVSRASSGKPKPRVYFSLPEANPRGRSHYMRLTGERFAFEDQTAGGDQDFNDFIGRIRFPDLSTAPDLVAPRVTYDDFTDRTNDNVTISGRISDNDSGVQSAEARFDKEKPFDLKLRDSGVFSVRTDFALNGSDDGTHRLQIRASDNAGNSSAYHTVRFALDTLSPAITLVLEADQTVAPNTTTLESINLVGTTEPGLAVRLDNTNDVVRANSVGDFAFPGVTADPGDNQYSVSTADLVGNPGFAQLTVRRVESDPPHVNLGLSLDTGRDATDGVTNNPTLVGTVHDENAVDLVEIEIDGSGFQDITDLVINGQFIVDPTAWTTILGTSPKDGNHIIAVRATDAFGSRSGSVETSLTLDTTPAVIDTFDLAPLSDSLPVGDLTTRIVPVSLVGETEAGVTLTLLETAVTTTSDVNGVFEFPDVPLQLGSNSYSVETEDAAGNRTRHTETFTRVEADAPQLQARLANDTAGAGFPPHDGLTRDPSIIGSFSDASTVALRAAVDSTDPATLRDITDTILEDGNFLLKQDRLERLLAEPLLDGAHSVLIRAEDEHGNQSEAVEIPFILDSQSPPLTIELDPAFDSIPFGDGQTNRSPADLLGLTDPNSLVVFEQELPMVADAFGEFRIADVNLEIGTNYFEVRSEDGAGNVTSKTFQFTRIVAPPQITAQLLNDTSPAPAQPNQQCKFPDDLAGWTTHVSGKRKATGAVVAAGCQAILAEGDSFTVSLKKEFTLPESTSTVRFSYRGLSFDTTDNFVRDAFEVSLTDGHGQPIVHTIKPGKDAFFNDTEGVGPISAKGISVDGQTVFVAIPDNEIGQDAVITFRLINNDTDTRSRVRITEFEVVTDNPVSPTEPQAPVEDRISSDISVSGVIVSERPISELRVGIDSLVEDEYRNVLPDVTVASNGRFELPMSLLDEIARLATGTRIQDGTHTVHLIATAEGELRSERFDLDLTVDTVSPSATVDVDDSLSSVEIQFDEPVGEQAFAGSSYSIKVDSATSKPSSVQLQSLEQVDERTVRLHLPARLANGIYTLEISSLVRDTAGNPVISGSPFQFEVAGSVTSVVELSPFHGEELVGPQRTAVVRFSDEIDPATVTSNSFYLIANGDRLGGRISVSRTNQFATFYPDTALPASSEVRVVVDGSMILDQNGNPIDADGDGRSGGSRIADFRTLSLKRIIGTNVFGYVFDSYNTNSDGSDIPVVGVTIRVDAFPEASAVTDENGYFELVDMPAPEFFVHIDGSTAVNAPPGTRYPVVGKPFHSVPGQRTQLEMDGEVFNVYLPPMAMDDVQDLSPSTDTLVGFGVAGKAQLESLFPNVDPTLWDKVSVSYPAGSATDSKGNVATRATVIPVPPDRIPAPLPPGLDPELVISIQAIGPNGEPMNQFDVPAPLTFPNLRNVPDGEKTLLMSFNHEAGRWESFGTATALGDVLVSDPGVGVRAPGWHSPQLGIVGTGGQVLASQGGLFGREGSDRLSPQTGLHYYALENLDTGLVIRGSVNVADQLFEQVILAKQASYRLSVLQLFSLKTGDVEFETGSCFAGCRITMPTVILDRNQDVDSDGEGLIDTAEFIVGTAINSPDTDADGLTDLAELRQRTDPFDGRAFPTGIIADLPLLGEANEVVIAQPDKRGTQLGYVASGSHGLAVVDLSQFDNPIMLGQLELPGNATDIDIDPQSAVAAVVTDIGLHFVDVSDPMVPRVADAVEVPFDGVVILDGTAYVAEGQALRSYDLVTGSRLATLFIGINDVVDMVAEGSMLYVSDTGLQLHAIEAFAGGMTARSSIELPTRTHTLFAGNGIVYATALISDSTDGGYLTVDATNPDDLRLISGLDQPQGLGALPGHDITLNGSGTGLLVGFAPLFSSAPVFSTLAVLDTSNPGETGRFQTAFELPGSRVNPPGAVAIGAGIAVVANGEFGLQIVNYLSFDALGEAPVVSAQVPALEDIDSTREGVQVEEGKSLRIVAEIADDVQVRTVDLLLDGRPVVSDISFPWDLTTTLPRIREGADQVQLQVRATDTGGNVALSDPLEVQLVEDTTAPNILTISPADRQLVSQDTRTVRIVFNESMDASTLNTKNVVLRGPEGQLLRPNNVQIRSADRVLQLTFDELPLGEFDVFVHGSQITDRAGNNLSNEVISSRFEVVQASITWVNPLGGSWDNSLNWDVDRIPGPTDDVLISVPGGVTVVHRNGNTQLRSLVTTNKLQHYGGTIEAETIELRTTMELFGGTIRNSRVIAGPAGGGVHVPNAGVCTHPTPVFNNRLDNVVLDASLTTGWGGYCSGATVQIDNDLTLNRTIYLAHGARLFFESSTNQTVQGTGAILAYGGTSVQQSFNKEIELGSELTVTASGQGASISVHNVKTLVNRGRIKTENSGRVAIAAGTSFANLGVLKSGGDIEIGNPLENIGRVRDEGGTITFKGGPYSIADDVTLDQGGTLHLEGDWTNQAVIHLTDGTLRLGGSFTPDDVGEIDRTSGNTSVHIAGLYDNTDRKTVLDSSTGNWHIGNGATILGGVIQGEDGASLRGIGRTEATLNGVTLDVDLVTPHSLSHGHFTRYYVQNGLTLNRKLSLGASTEVYFQGTQTVAGDGVVQTLGLACGTFCGANTLLSAQTGITTIGPDLTVDGRLTEFRGSFVNRGTIRANTAGQRVSANGEFHNRGRVQVTEGSVFTAANLRELGQFEISPDASVDFGSASVYTIDEPIAVPGGATLKLDGDWTNQSEISVNGGTLNLAGTLLPSDIGKIVRTAGSVVQLSGLLDNSNNTLVLDDTTGTLILANGTVKGGIVKSETGAQLGQLLNTTSTLDGVTLEARFVTPGTTGYLQRSDVHVFNGLTVNQPITLNPQTRLFFKGGNQTLEGNGVITMNGVGCGSFCWGGIEVGSETSSLTIGAEITINGRNTRFAGSGPLINLGSLRADVAGLGISIDSPFTNQGSIEIAKGTSLNTRLGVVLTETSDISLQIGGSFTQTNSGRFIPSNDFTLNGTLNIHRVDDYQPSEGDSFPIISGGNRLNGSEFDTVNGLVLPDGLVFNPIYSDTGLTLIAALPLSAATGAASTVSATDLDYSTLQPLVNAAIQRWEMAGISTQAADWLRSVTVRIDNLPDSYLGFAARDILWIDGDAAGYGWFVDTTPSLDEEFPADGTPPGEQMDLLTVLSHELGHLLGLSDVDPQLYPNELLSKTLVAGARRMPTTNDVQTAPEFDDRLETAYGSLQVGDSDSLTSAGTEFWLTFPTSLARAQEDFSLNLAISGESLTSGRVEIPGLGFHRTFNVFPGEVTTIDLPTGADLGFSSDRITDKGIHVIARSPVTVYGVSRAIESTDAFLALPMQLLGSGYRVLGYKNLERTPDADETFPGTEFAIVAALDDTNVTITPVVDSGSHPAGVPYLIRLNRGETYLLQNSGFEPNDLSGTAIHSDQPIAVFGGHAAANIPAAAVGYADYIVEQLPPTSAWGTDFLTAPLSARSGGDTFRILAHRDNTSVEINGQQVATLGAGAFHEQTIDSAAVITTNKPVLVAQYAHSARYDQTASGDPFMMLVPASSQLLSQYTVFSQIAGLPEHYINLIVPDTALNSTLLDGAPIDPTEYIAIAGSGHSFARVTATESSHRLTGPLPFAAYVFGFGQDESYGYSAGMSAASTPVASIAELSLNPQNFNLPTSTSHSVTATIRDNNGAPVVGSSVEFTVSGANTATGSSITDVNGNAAFRYTGYRVGADTIEAVADSFRAAAEVNWTAGAPTIRVDSPVDGHSADTGTALLISGLASAGGTGIQLASVTANRIPVDALSDNGTFFTSMQLSPGENLITLVATDELGQQGSTTISVTGLQDQPVDDDADLFRNNVSASFSAEYGRTLWREHTSELFVDLSVRNVGQFAVGVPLLVGIDHISDPRVRVRDANEVTPEGIPVYDFSDFITGETLQQNEASAFRPIRFYNPTGERFTFDVTFYGKLNSSPKAVSVPKTEAIVGQPYVYSFSGVDVNGDNLTYSLITGPSDMEIASDLGSVHWNPTASDLGTHSIGLKLTDGVGGSVEQHYTLTVVAPPANRPPVFLSVPVVHGNIESVYEYAVNLSDADADPIALRVANGPTGLAVDSNGLMTWQPSGSQLGTHEVTLEASDGHGGTALQKYQIVVNGAVGNRPPVISTLPLVTGTENRNYEYEARAFDSDNDPLRYELITGPEEMTINPETGLLQWNGTAVLAGTHSVELSVADGRGGLDNQRFELTVVPEPANTNPEISSTPPAQATVGQRLGYFVRGRDADADSLTYSVGGPAGMTIDGDGVLIWQPSTNQLGANNVEITVMDSRGGSASQSFVIEVLPATANQAPRVGSSPILDAIAERVYLYQVIASDPDGDLLQFELSDAPAEMEIDPHTGLIRWTPAEPDIYRPIHDLAAVSVRVSDGRGGEANQGFEILVRATDNLNPTFTSPTPGLAITGTLFRYEASANDPDGDALEFDLVVKPEGMTVDPVGGVVSWRPEAGDVGLNEVILRVQDGHGGVDLQRFGILNSQPNTAPVITSDPVTEAGVDLPYRYRVRAQDADGDTLRYRLDAASSGMTIDSESGIFRWIPTASQLGDHTVTMIVSDVVAGQGKLTAEATQTFTISVLQETANQPPEIHSSPRDAIRLGNLYHYAVKATDANADPLHFLLDRAPRGMTVEAAGRLRWEPTTSQVGLNFVELRVHDGRGGEATQTFVIDVISSVINHDPVIVSTPVITTLVNQPYQYDLQSQDPDGDLIVWSLVKGPIEMSLSELSGTLRWTPDVAHIGSHPVVVEALDALGGSAQQRFDLDVRAVNSPPNITSHAQTGAVADRVYSYAVRALDPDQDALNFEIASGPAGMTIDPASGLILFTPDPSQIGTHAVVIRASDPFDGIAEQSYELRISETAGDGLPSITSAPGLIATVGSEYRYAATAFDPDGEAVDFSLLESPAGMTLNPTTGLLSWVPEASQLGTADVLLAVSDGGGIGGTQRYAIRVLGANKDPLIASVPPGTVTSGLPYQYDLLASDPDNDRLVYELVVGPDGATIDERGRMFFATDVTTPGPHRAILAVRDGRGGVATQTVDFEVVEDLEPPTVNLSLSTSTVAIGDEVTIQVQARDNVRVRTRSLQVGGRDVPIDVNNRATVRVENTGSLPVVGNAFDRAGNQGTDTVELLIVDPGDVTGPVVDIVAPAAGATITTFTEVVGTVVDDSLVNYSLSVAPFNGEFVEIAGGTAVMENESIGVFDPTLLANDTYRLRLAAVDAGGNRSVVERELHVRGQLKLGNFNLSFVDLSVPVAGIPITIVRTYDTLNAHRASDLAPGWSLELFDTNLRSNVKQTGQEQDLIFNPFFTGARVFVTLPGGERAGFTFKPEVAPGLRGGFLGIMTPAFEPDPGVRSTLSVQPFDLRMDREGQLTAYGSNLPYNPASPAFGGKFTVTSREGFQYTINGLSGRAEAVEDPAGNRLTFRDDGVFSSTGVSVRFERDARGRISAVVDPEGNRISYHYDHRDDLVGVIDREGNLTNFRYLSDPRHYLDEIIDPLGRTGVRTKYDSSGRLTGFTDAHGGTGTFEYDFSADRFHTTDALGNTTTLVFDHQGNNVTRINPDGGVIAQTFDNAGNVLTVTNPLGATTTFAYDNRGNEVAVTDPLGYSEFASYTDTGMIRTVTDASGNTTTLQYDGRNLTAYVLPDGTSYRTEYNQSGLPVRFVAPNGASTVISYDSQGRPNRTLTPLGASESFTLDGNGQVTASTLTYLSGSSTTTASTSSDYDKNGRLLRSTDPFGNHLLNEYDAVGNLISTTNQTGSRTGFSYDDLNQLTAVTHLDGATETFEYDILGRQISQTDELGNATHFEYDSMNRLTTVVLPDATPETLDDNPRTRRVYDLAGQITGTIDPDGVVKKFDYDLSGQLTSIRESDGSEIQFEYGPTGLLQAQTNSLGATTVFQYDSVGRRTSQTLPDGSSSRILLNASGLPSHRIDTSGRVTLFEYTADDQIKAVTDPLENRTDYVYDQLGNLIKVTDALGNVTRFDHDLAGRQISRKLPSGQMESHTYDAAGNLSSHTDFEGKSTDYSYDSRNRLVRERFSDGTESTYSYYENGLRESSTTELGTISYEYDERSRLAKVINPNGSFVGYTYDNSGRRSATLTDNGEISYLHNSIGLLSELTDHLGNTTTYTYDSGKNLVSTLFANGTRENRGYDALNRLTQIKTVSENGDLIDDIRYTRASNGVVLAVSDLDSEHTYSYDTSDRLIGETIKRGDETTLDRRFEYDAVGNLVNESSDTANSTYSYDANGQLREIQKASSVTTLSYDFNGNLVTRAGDGSTTAYEYDSQNRLIKTTVTQGGTEHVVEYAYDADGNRVARTVDGVQSVYLIDANRQHAQNLEEQSTDGSLDRKLVHGLRLVSQHESGETRYHHSNALGSTRNLSDELGAITDTYVYDSKGNVIEHTGDSDNEYLFTGEHRDPLTKLDYLRARYLDAELGRFTTRDEFTGISLVPITQNPYLYAHASAPNHTDPSGHLVGGLLDVMGALSIQGVLRAVEGGSRVCGPLVTANTLAFTAGFAASMTQLVGAIIGGMFNNASNRIDVLRVKIPKISKLGKYIDTITLGGSLTVNENLDPGFTIRFGIKPRHASIQPNTNQALGGRLETSADHLSHGVATGGLGADFSVAVSGPNPTTVSAAAGLSANIFSVHACGWPVLAMSLSAGGGANYNLSDLAASSVTPFKTSVTFTAIGGVKLGFGIFSISTQPRLALKAFGYKLDVATGEIT